MEERIQFLTLLDSGGRLGLCTQDEVRPGFVSGMFAIPKDSLRDRLIMDSRPGNLLEEDESRWIQSLGSIFQLRSMFVKPGFKVITFAEDIREFYYAFTDGRGFAGTALPACSQLT